MDFSGAIIELQSMLNHIALRICETLTTTTVSSEEVGVIIGHTVLVKSGLFLLSKITYYESFF